MGRIVFSTVTFADLIEAVRKELPPYASEMQEMVGDFEDFCTASGLIPSAPYMMRVVQCGDTLEENIEFDVYYHPASRSYSELGYLGLYKEKSVRAVGKLTKTVRAIVHDDGNLELLSQGQDLTEEEKSRIVASALAGKQNHGYELDDDRLYFLVEKFHRTDGDGPGFHKTTKYGIPGEKHFDLRQVIDVTELPSTAAIAQALASRSWE